MDELIRQWKEAQKGVSTSPSETQKMIRKVQQKRKYILYSHIIIITVLTMTLVVLSYVFLNRIIFKTVLSRISIGLMLGGLLMRILIEVISVVKSRLVHWMKPTTQTMRDALIFYRFRQWVQGPVTLFLTGTYIIGFYLLSPELGSYMTLQEITILDGGFLLIAIILIIIIRKGVRKEMNHLSNLCKFQKDLDGA